MAPRSPRSDSGRSAASDSIRRATLDALKPKAPPAAPAEPAAVLKVPVFPPAEVSTPRASGGYSTSVAPPRKAVEAVTRAPVPATSAAPSSMPVSSNTPQVGFANALTNLGKQALKSVTAVSAVTKTSPAAVAVGRAAARGANPVVASPCGKLATTINKKYQIVFVSSEVAPWSKTGGLGEAMDGLPIAMAALGHRVMTIAPRYDQYAEAWDTSYWSEVPMGNKCESVHAFHAYESKVDRVFVDSELFLAKIWGKSGSMIYGPKWGEDYPDNQYRFTYFAKAVLKIIQELPLGGSCYGGDTIVVVNDWHCGLVPVYLSLQKKSCPEAWKNTKCALLIHNAVFQGRFDRDDAKETNNEAFGLPEVVMSTFTFNMMVKLGNKESKVKRCVNWLASAAKYADKILTVSPTYAWEITNLPEMGVELEDIFLMRGVTGIVNGVKETVSPMNPTFTKKCKMPSTFSAKDVDEKKAALKAQLQEMYGLPKTASSALCVFVGRMDLQKGYDILLSALQECMGTMDLQLIVIGTGRADLVASTKALATKFPNKIHLAGWCGPERYAMVAGADYNLMPSRWEPCGLAQMESMRFGTLPVVAKTGGLLDTVQDMETGIHMDGAVSVAKESDASSVQLMKQVLEKCVKIYGDKATTSRMRKAAMAAGMEFTWSNSALQYEAVFEELGAVDFLKGAEATVTIEEDKRVA